MSAIIVTAPPTKTALSIQEVKDHLRVTHTEEDAMIQDMINRATDVAETVTKTALMEQTMQWYLDSFCSFTLDFPRAPLQSVTFVKYKHPTTGVLTTLSSTEYLTDLVSMPARIQPAYGKVWPTAREELNAVVMEFVAGYAEARNVPYKIRQAMLMTIAHWYENREAWLTGTIIQEVPIGVNTLLHSERVWAK